VGGTSRSAAKPVFANKRLRRVASTLAATPVQRRIRILILHFSVMMPPA